MSRKILILAAIFLVAVAFGCKDDDDEKIQPGNEVRMSSGAFIPANLTVPAGTTVKWINNSTVDHTVTSNDDLFDQLVTPGNEFSYTFSTAGTFSFVCTIHPGMTGAIVVE